MNNEEKILAMLEKHGEMLEKHGEMLEKHGEMLEKMDQRIDRMDQRMGQMQEQLDRVDERSQRTALLLETEVERKLNLLYEGHGTIMATLDKLLDTKGRMESMESDIIVLKTAVKMLTKEIAELKKAQ